MFGLAYRPDRIRFEPAPPHLLAHCPQLENARWSRRLWIYGRAATPTGTVTIVGGTYVPKPPAQAAPLPDPKGAVIETSPGRCTLLGPAREVLQYPEDLIAPPVLHALIGDLVARYRAAFGGAAALRTVLRRQHALPTGRRDADLRDALAGD